MNKKFSTKIRKGIRTGTRSPGTTSIGFSVVTVNDEHRKPEFNLKRVLV